ncbi:MAG TPA: DNA cytosine methyltransferase [Gallicola sp.]|nr:DNA cytosine methyltransferase [Gallicola sp.]
MSKNIIDLFCGCGGFSKGFENAGYTVDLAIDSWKDAIDTFNINHKKSSGVTKNIYDFTNDEIKDFANKNNIVGIIGGPPCQGFSMVGKRQASDERNTLYLQYVRFVEQINPEFFILENVKGLLTLEKGYFKKEIIDRFSELGYNVTYKVLRASDYGVPQNRERVFFVGLRKDKFKDKFFEYPEPVDHIVGTEEALSDLPSLDNGEDATKYKTEPQNNFQKLMRKKSKDLKNNEITIHTEQTKKIISMIPDGGNIKSLPEEYYKVRNYGSAFKRMNSKEPSITIDCGHRNYFHYKENRIPTARESARIQSFPDDFEFLGTKTSQYTQIGNAVPVLLAEAVANSMNKMYEELDKKESE